MRGNDDTRTVAVVEIMAATAAIAAVAAASSVAVSATDAIGRVLIMAVAVGVLAARFRTWPAAVTTAITAALIFPIYLAPDDAAVAGGFTPWGFTPLFAVALLVGRGYRVLARTGAHPGPAMGDNRDRAAERPSLFAWPERPAAARTSDRLDRR